MAGRIFFTGGGTAGHVTPNLALIERLTAEGWQAAYIGSKKGIERTLTKELDIPFYTISTGKLRRYFAWQNFLDPVLILWGVLQSIYLCLRYRPNIVFSKGGFVAVPLVVGAWICRVPVISHESDITPGLANKLCFPFSRYICVNFSQTEQYLPSGKTKVTGSPVRKSLLEGDASRGREFLGFDTGKPILLVFGGSLGAKVINDCVRLSLSALLEKFQIIHIAGANNLESEVVKNAGYVQKEYLQREFGDVLAAADLVLSRAGANSIYELLLTRKPHVLVPLSIKASRGDQIVNARIFAGAGMSSVIQEEELSPESLMASLNQLIEVKDARVARLKTFKIQDAVQEITDLIAQTASE